MNKCFMCFAFLTIVVDLCQAQVGVGTATPEQSAVLDVSSSALGFLVPRMTLAQRNAIVSPATGLIIFQTDNTPGLYYNSGTPSAPAWATVGSNAAQWLTNGTSLYYNGGNIGIGTSTPTAKLQVAGGDANINGLTVGKGTGGIATNSAYGYQAIKSNTTGNQNAAFGYQALAANTIGSWNAAFGFSSLNKNISGNSNTAFGFWALSENTAGGNTGIGAGALHMNTTGYNNTAIGYYSASSNQTGNNNIAIGPGTLNSNYTGNANVAIGVDALSISEDRSNLVAIGDSALMNNGTDVSSSMHAKENVAVGSKALMNNTTGYRNTGVGFQSLYSSTTGYQNSAFGYQALYSNSEGLFNTALGSFSLNGNQTGGRNTAYGYMSLFYNTTGSYNTTGGMYSMAANTTGANNTALGYQALYSSQTGSSNVALGYNAGRFETESNRLYIDNQSRGNLANGRQKSLIYGIFDANPANQMLAFNATVGIGTTEPAATAALDISSTSKGILIPRLNRSQRDAIASPPEGLMIFCTDCGVKGSLSMFINGSWETFTHCTTPPTPTQNSITISFDQIMWRWNFIHAEVDGCRFNTVNDYSSAIEMGETSTATQTGLICDTVYSAYVWSYNSCSSSSALQLTATMPSAVPATPVAGTHESSGSYICWWWSSVSGAAGYKWNSVNDVSSAIDAGTSTYNIQTGLNCVTSYTSYAWAYNACGYSAPLTMTCSTDICCGNTKTINHIAGDVAPVTKTVTYGTVDDIAGEPDLCWITSNLGASHQATAKNDATEASAGWYWQFNRKQGFKHDGSILTPAWTINMINENSDWSANQDPCRNELGGYWRIPTSLEWTGVDAAGGWTDWNDPWDSDLKMHAAGYLHYWNGALDARGQDGAYNSSSQYDYNYQQAYYFWINTSYSIINTDGDKANGLSMRCVRE